MSSLKPTDDQKLEVMQILQRVQQKDELEQEEEAFLERLERFDLGKQINFSVDLSC